MDIERSDLLALDDVPPKRWDLLCDGYGLEKQRRWLLFWTCSLFGAEVLEITTDAENVAC